MTGYRVKDWSEFQHYKDRNPPWIRLHKRLLDNRKFHSLPDDSRALAPMLWLLASESEDIGSGIIALEDDDIAFRLRRSMNEFKKALKPLLLNGFIEALQTDSEMLSPCQQLAVPETEAEAETEADSEETESPPASRVLTRMPFIDIPDEWLAVCVAEKGWTENVALDVWQNFRSYWRDGKGKTVKREEWSASWRTWYRKENIRTGGQHGNFNKPTTIDIIKDGIALARAQREQASARQT